jgi:tRNA wybutosine-synthesizing protein 1
MDPHLAARLRKQSYYLVGEHSGVKLCHWMRESLTGSRVCYKQQFYGIKTHRCLQMSHTVNQCNQNCTFCWRYQGETETGFSKIDDPEYILEQAILGQRTLLTGYKGNPKCDMERWKQAQEPNQVAISLSGEPTLYPRLSEFIEICKKRGMTTFVVSNGTQPEVLERLDPLPTQLYITVAAPNKEIYQSLCRPLINDGWERLQKTLEILPSLNTRTVIRHTLVKHHNLGYVEDYARLDRIANPLLIEPKAYVLVGDSRKRLTLENMPSHEEIRAFSKQLAETLGLEIADEKPDSRVTVLAGNKKNVKIPGLE